ncbi:hypothetical protein, partial [Salmonella sp. s54412]
MANKTKGFGMTAELQRKQDAKYDPELAKKAIAFIEKNTERKVVGTLHESLKDGVILCHLANAFKPGAIKKISESKMAFKMMENISNFLKVCGDLGLKNLDLFQ